MTAPEPPTAEQHEQRPWRTFVILAAAAALTILDVSKVGVALPAIQKSTGGSDSEIQFMLVGYTIAYALFLLPSGRLGDILPRRLVFLTGTSVFVAASLLCSLAPDALWLVIGRIVQGAGAGILMPQVLGLIQRSFPAARRTRPLAVLAAIVSATSTFGPVIAGAVLQAVGATSVGTGDSWRALFWIDVVVGAVVLPLAWRFVAEPGGERRTGFDGVGVALLVPGVVFAVAPLSAISESTPPAPWMAVVTAIGIGFFAAFLVHESRLARSRTQPLVDPTLFRMRHFPAGLAISGFAYAAGTGGTLAITLTFEEVAGQSPLQTALWMLPAAAAMVLGSTITARLPQERSYRLITVGTAIGTVALAAIAFAIGTVDEKALAPVLCGLLLVNTFGSSFVGAPNQARALLLVPEFRSSIAGSLIQFSQRVGSAIGIALVLILFSVYRTDVVPWSGRTTLGPTLALALAALFTAAGCITSVIDSTWLQNRRLARASRAAIAGDGADQTTA